MNTKSSIELALIVKQKVPREIVNLINNAFVIVNKNAATILIKRYHFNYDLISNIRNRQVENYLPMIGLRDVVIPSDTNIVFTFLKERTENFRNILEMYGVVLTGKVHVKVVPHIGFIVNIIGSGHVREQYYGDIINENIEDDLGNDEYYYITGQGILNLRLRIDTGLYVFVIYNSNKSPYFSSDEYIVQF